jgi:hypothetical protein
MRVRPVVGATYKENHGIGMEDLDLEDFTERVIRAVSTNVGESRDEYNTFAEEAVGVSPPRAFLALDASIFDHAETHRIVREDIKQNRIEYVFPDGVNQIDLIEECRALTMLEDFDTMYDLTMQMLAGKPIIINIKNYNGSKSELCGFQVVDRYQNLRGIETIDEYPCLVTWLTEFIGAYIEKKYPLPTQKPSRPQAYAAYRVYR